MADDDDDALDEGSPRRALLELQQQSPDPSLEGADRYIRRPFSRRMRDVY